MMPLKHEPLLTIADWEMMPDDGKRYEIIEGELSMACAPSLKHPLILKNLITDTAALRQTGVSEYWIVDPEQASIELHVLQDHILRMTALLAGSDEITSTVLPGYRCPVASIFKFDF